MSLIKYFLQYNGFNNLVAARKTTVNKLLQRKETSIKKINDFLGLPWTSTFIQAIIGLSRASFMARHSYFAPRSPLPSFRWTLFLPVPTLFAPFSVLYSPVTKIF